MYHRVTSMRKREKKSTSTLKWPRDKNFAGLSSYCIFFFFFFFFLFSRLALSLSVSIEKWQQQEDKQNKNNTDDIISTTVVSSLFYSLSPSSSLIRSQSFSSFVSNYTSLFFFIFSRYFPIAFASSPLIYFQLGSCLITSRDFFSLSNIKAAHQPLVFSNIHSTDKHPLYNHYDTVLLLFLLLQSSIANQRW